MWLYYFVNGSKYNQIKCKELNLDTNDIYVLTYLKQLVDSGKSKFEIRNGEYYHLITYRKLEEDCGLTYWKAQNFRKRLRYYVHLGLLDIYKPNLKTPKTFFKLNLKPIMDSDENFEICNGQDKTLKWYSKASKQKDYCNYIEYCKNVFRYYSTGIIYETIIKYNQSSNRVYPDSPNSFAEILQVALLRCFENNASKSVYEKYFKSFTMIIEPTGHIKLNFLTYANEGILYKYRFAIERAICDAFLYICRDIDVRQKLGEYDSNLY